MADYCQQDLLEIDEEALNQPSTCTPHHDAFNKRSRAKKEESGLHDIPGPAGVHQQALNDTQDPQSHSHRYFAFYHSRWSGVLQEVIADPHYTLELSYIAEVMSWHEPKRFNMLVNIAAVTLVAKDMEIVVNDPSGEMCATVDRICVQKWCHALCEGAVLLVANVLALPSTRRPCFLLVREPSLLKVF